MSPVTVSTLHWDNLFDWRIVAALELVWVGVAAVVIVLQRRSAAATISWLLALIFLPGVGLVLYRLIGPLRLQRKRIKHKLGRKVVRTVTGARASLSGGYSDEAQLARVAAHPEQAPPLSATSCQLFFAGDAFYASLAKAILDARDHVHLEFYIWEPDRIGLRLRDLLVEKAAAGVRVRLLVDHLGSSKLGRRFIAPLLRAGGEVSRFNPLSLPIVRGRRMDFRTHRKIAVCDGCVGFAGGMNVSEVHSEEFGAKYWRDTQFRLEGPAVWPLQRIFLEDWYFATETLPGAAESALFPDPRGGARHRVQILSGGPDHEQPLLLQTFFTALTRAESRLCVTTPYFVPEEPLVTALSTAALRGVDVQLLIPSRGDSRVIDYAARSYLPELLECGVKVFEYLPRFIHAKTFVIDDDVAIVGSANLDTRSFRLNFELAAIFYDAALNAQLHAAFVQDVAMSRPITLAELSALSLPVRLAQASARLLSPLL